MRFLIFILFYFAFCQADDFCEWVEKNSLSAYAEKNSISKYIDEHSMLTAEPRVTRSPLALRLPVVDEPPTCIYDGMPLQLDSSELTMTGVVHYYNCIFCNRVFSIRDKNWPLLPPAKIDKIPTCFDDGQPLVPAASSLDDTDNVDFNGHILMRYECPLCGKIYHR